MPSPVREYKRVIQDSNDPGYLTRILVGTATTGSVRIEWHAARQGAIVPANWGHVAMTRNIPTWHPLRYPVADAQNMIVKVVIEREFEWLFLLEHDVVVPHWLFLELNRYIREEKTPVVSGLYFLRAHPSEPLIYRGRGTGAYYGDDPKTGEPRWSMGDVVYCDGVPTGCLLIHAGILREMWKDAEPYTVGGESTRRVFQTPRMQWYDPENNQLNSTSGTSDLDWCTRVIKGDYMRKAGWGEYVDGLENPEFPFIVDTALFCRHINPDGMQFPLNWPDLHLVSEYAIRQRIEKPVVNVKAEVIEAAGMALEPSE